MDVATIPDVDVLCAGFPCQPFSDAGKRRGLRDPRGSRFFQVARTLDANQPAAFILENGQGLKTHDGGRTLEVIRRHLSEELGYSFQARILRACDFGLPQLRPRLFMVGCRDPRTRFEFPESMPMHAGFGGHCNREVGYTVLASGWGKPFGVKRAWDAYVVDGYVRRVGVPEARMMQGFPMTRLLDMVEGRSKQVFKDWLEAQTPQFRHGIEVVAMDGFTGFRTAASEELPDAVAVMEPFHVVALVGDALDRCRQRVQQDTCGHRGRTGDPLYGIRRVAAHRRRTAHRQPTRPLAGRVRR